ncbi:phytanoyl-CoA dioxygenase family protein [Streptosporangium sp. NBC_01755]|uniref:phytanoyl-CoA dioxygenase family protein n=1 Tax=Streptosporangium sp. NBC_01755 TaxID=2975949 RepID=UPI002DDB4329|nr:phytanoyl-CoA dioxygenase family protein [Streptosporangium sp. NBC_01755]WSD01860.1 phytanoyl-CoA dioxygenase family protein [Streptosporangium sp. NBC_01755]
MSWRLLSAADAAPVPYGTRSLSAAGGPSGEAAGGPSGEAAGGPSGEAAESASEVAGPLSEAEVQSFAADGYLVRRDFFTPEVHRELLAGADRLIELVVDSSVVLGRRNPRGDLLLDASGELVIRRISPVVDVLPVAAALAADPMMLAAVRQLTGHSGTLMESKLNYKQRLPPVEGLPFLPTRASGDTWPLHHDWGYYRQQGYPPSTISVAVSLDDTENRGPMTVVPGSHREPTRLVGRDPDSGSGRVEESSVGPLRRKIHAPARSVLFFHSLLVHSSSPNESGLPRRILHLTYAPPFADGTAATRRNGRWQEAAARFERRYREMGGTRSLTSSPKPEHGVSTLEGFR